MKELHEWFRKNKRDFPWRQDRTPYKVWISEVMLQQTRASVVIPYFLRWLALFPDVTSLASATLENIIKAWEGLGYYSRARNLYAGAQQIVQEFKGEFPKTRADLEKIQGIGPYTIGAILSFGFQQRAAAVDGNVTRVLARYFLIETNVCKQPAKRLIQEKAESVLDEKEPWVTAEALIELGATICVLNPKCSDCPLKENCLGFKHNKMEYLPIKNETEKTIHLKRYVMLIVHENEILLKKGKKGQVMADLYEFPYFEIEEKGSDKKWIARVKQELCLEMEMVQRFSEVHHTFTRYKAHLYPVQFRAKEKRNINECFWVPHQHLVNLPFSSGHRRIVEQFIQQKYAKAELKNEMISF